VTSTSPARSPAIFASVWQLIDSVVLFPVQLTAQALFEHIARLAPAYPVLTVALSDLPDGTREWLLETVPPVFDAADRSI
jgi:hypothetical protein